MWYYLNQNDYQNIIKPMKNNKLKYQLLSQYKGRIPMLKESYIKLQKQYG